MSPAGIFCHITQLVPIYLNCALGLGFQDSIYFWLVSGYAHVFMQASAATVKHCLSTFFFTFPDLVMQQHDDERLVQPCVYRG